MRGWANGIILKALGWVGPLARTMSGQQAIPGFEGCSRSETRPGTEAFRASIRREMRYLLAISDNASGPASIRPAGIAHSLGVCLIEDWNMARGASPKTAGKGESPLPTFIDIKLTQADRKRFLEWFQAGPDPVKILTDFTDTGYRVGCAWSGEHQSYTVSVTCRSPEQPNNGLCMTSFAKSLHQAVCLAWFKHSVIAYGAWRTYAPEEQEGWG